MLSPFAETSALVYTGARALAAIVVALVALRSRAGLAGIVGQGASDAASILFLVAYLDYDFRDAVKVVAPPLLLFVIAWEWRAIAARFRDDDEESPSGGDPLGVRTALTLPLRLTYELLMVIPAVVAGGFLVFDLLFPRQWPFPNAPAALRCEPAELASGDELILRMVVPHGGELGVLTPGGRFLYVVEFARGGTPRAERFEHLERLSLPVTEASGTASPGGPREPLFADTGTYRFRLSELGEVSASRTCEVRFTSPRPFPP